MKKSWIVVAAALVLASCADRAPGAGQGDVSDDPALQYGACHQDGTVEFAPAPDLLASVERWFGVVSTTPAMTSDGTLAGYRTVTLDVEVEEIKGDQVSAPATQQVAIHNSMLPGVVWGLESGGRAFLALGSENLEREMVLYTMIQTPEGQFFFAGECQYQAFTEPLRRLLGDRFDVALSAIIGTTDPATIWRGSFAHHQTNPTSRRF